MLFESHKQEVLEIAKKMQEMGLVASTSGNVSTRPTTDKLVITPSGMPYPDLLCTDMVTMGLSGKVIDGSRKPSSEHSLHREVYLKRPDVLAVVHTHSIYATAFAAARRAIPVLVDELLQVNDGQVGVAEYAPPGSIELAKNCIGTLGNKSAVLLANHGLVGVGKNLEEALEVCSAVEKAAHIAYLAITLTNSAKAQPATT